MPRTRLLIAAIAFVALLAAPAAAAPIAYDGFDYSPGELGGENGGTGDWKNAWSGDSDIEVILGGWSYVDSLGQSLVVGGNRIGLASGSDTKKAERQLNQSIGNTTDTIWLSFIFGGSTTSAVNNFSLGDGLFVGQGTKDSGSTTIQLSDQDGLVSNSGVSAATQAFLVARVDFQSGDEDVWLWINPDLDAEPDTLSADANGSVKDFETDFIRAQLSDTTAGLDEVRFGLDWMEILRKTPEPGTFGTVAGGLAALSWLSRRRKLS